MRFRFCGGLDCPDWVLAEITILARMSSVKMKLLSGQVIKNLLGEDLDYEKVTKYTSDAKYDASDVKAAISVLTFILSSAARYDLESAPLSDELQQLGLPKEHSASLCKLFADNSARLQQHFKLKSLKLSQIEKVDYKVKHVLDTTGQQVVEEPIVELTLVLGAPSLTDRETVTFSMTTRKFQTFLHELKEARACVRSALHSL